MMARGGRGHGEQSRSRHTHMFASTTNWGCDSTGTAVLGGANDGAYLRCRKMAELNLPANKRRRRWRTTSPERGQKLGQAAAELDFVMCVCAAPYCCTHSSPLSTPHSSPNSCRRRSLPAFFWIHCTKPRKALYSTVQQNRRGCEQMKRNSNECLGSWVALVVTCLPWQGARIG